MGSSIDSVDKEHQVTVDDAKELAIETVNAWVPSLFYLYSSETLALERKSIRKRTLTAF
jgi:hypothetical protein